jgi:hypothetical protein
MAQTFFTWNESGMTTLFDGTISTDTNDDFVVYFGSNDSTRKVQAQSDPGVDNITLTPDHAYSLWADLASYVNLGTNVRTSTNLGYYFECTTAGTKHATTEPTWSTAPNENDTIVDGTVTWTNRGTIHEPTEIKLATTAVGLDSATGGAALSLGTSLSGGSAQAIYIRLTDATGGGVASTNCSIDFNTLVETVI